MSADSSIEWTDATWNPVRGCTKVSAGCKNCYAETFSERWRGVKGHAFEQGFDLRLVPEKLPQPLRWKKPRRIFVNSMSDLFHEDIPDEYIAAVFGVMAAVPQHTFQVLTKRAERMARWFENAPDVGLNACRYLDSIGFERGCGSAFEPDDWPLRNVQLGVSVENQEAAEERIPHLLRCPADVRFLSAEPLLGALQLDLPRCEEHNRDFVSDDGAWCNECAANGYSGEMSYSHWLDGAAGVDQPGVNWVIVGGESGHGARPFDVAWARSIVEECRAQGVPVFVKQLGAAPVDGRTIDVKLDSIAHGDRMALTPRRNRKGGDPSEWPEDLRVREFPHPVET